ncbi:hypothetical protein GGR53DRAFT_230595 [Hypoxylon sp. FL1150]|nr:hypothetical protein GGR53DRAFT_230595 [Hypoxylon sp. FL1150]
MRKHRRLQHAHPTRFQDRGTKISQPSKRRAEGRDSRKSRDNMRSRTFTTTYTKTSVVDNYQAATQQPICSQNSGSGCVAEHNQLPDQRPSIQVPGPARNSEIYGLALGTCFLFLVMGWLFVVAIRTSVGLFGRTAKNQGADPEGAAVRFEPFESHPPVASRSLLYGGGVVAAGGFIKSARRNSINIAIGLKRDIGSIGRKSSLPPPMDEEAAVGGNMEGFGITAGDSFLHQRHRTMAVLPA